MTTPITETVYIGYDNTFDLSLTADDVAVDLSTITRFTLAFGAYAFDSDNDSVFTWTGLGVVGKLQTQLGQESIAACTEKATLISYDPINTNGIRWPIFLLIAK